MIITLSNTNNNLTNNPSFQLVVFLKFVTSPKITPGPEDCSVKTFQNYIFTSQMLSLTSNFQRKSSEAKNML